MKSCLSTVLAVPLALLGLVGTTTPTWAVPVTVTHQNSPTCDPLFVPDSVDELGLVPAPFNFPPGEQIAAFNQATSLVACASTDTPASNVLITMTNLTSEDFVDVWYVSDPETSLSNVDGLVNGEEAFQIDSQISDPGGVNHPLVFESLAANDIFEAGETWEFIIDDYSNTIGLAASAFGSPGAVGAFSGVDGISSGSIIAVIPLPAAIWLFASGMVGLVGMARRDKQS